MTEVRLREWSTAEPLEVRALAGIGLDGAAERRLAADLKRAGRLAIDELASGLRISSFSFVGRLQLGSLTITVEPKLAKEPLLALVRYAYGLRDVIRHGTTSFETNGALLPDLLSTQLLAETKELVARGLPRRYVERAEALSMPRGRIDLGALSRRSSPEMTLPCRHHPRSADHLVLRVVRAGLELAASIAQDRQLRLELRRLAAHLGAEVGGMTLTQTSVARARRGLTRLEASAGPALDLIALLLDGQAITLDDETSVRLPGFLFDMNRFFQALIGRWLREHLPECQVMDERSLGGLLRYATGLNPRARRAPAPRPDFAVKGKARPIVLLDAKYRDLWERPLPREMLYQLAMYATSGAGEPIAVILYPTEDAAAKEARIDIHNVVSGEVRGSVALRPVPLDRLVALVNETFEERCEEAQRLAFGGTSLASGLRA